MEPNTGYAGSMTGDGQHAQRRPIGVFHAVRTRDAVGITRDGWPYFVQHGKGHDVSGGSLFEIQFGDGEWLLAVSEDLTEFDD